MYKDAPANVELNIKWDDEKKPNLIQFSTDGSMAYSLDGNAVNMPDSTGTIYTQRNKVLYIWKKDTEGKWKVSLLLVYPKKIYNFISFNTNLKIEKAHKYFFTQML